MSARVDSAPTGRSPSRRVEDLDPNGDPDLEWLRDASEPDLRAFARERIAARPVWTVAFVLLSLMALPAIGLLAGTIGALLARDHRSLIFALPLLAVAAIVIGLPWWRFRVAVRSETIALQRVAKREICVRCRYDLSGVRSDVCPECGTAIRPPDASATR